MTSTPTSPDVTQQGPLLTLSEASAYLRCSKPHVSKLIRSRVPNSHPLPAVRLGRRVYIRRDSPARYLHVVESRYGWLRPGEIFGLQRRHVQPTAVKIEQRVYAGKLDTPKSKASSRLAAIPATLASEIQAWLAMLPADPEAWLFPSETGLSWVNFQVLRRTCASLAHAAGIDPKIRADQMGNGIGVNLDEYTVTALDQPTAAVELLEASLLH